VEHHISELLRQVRDLDRLFAEVSDEQMRDEKVSLQREISALEREIASKDSCLLRHQSKVKKWEATFHDLAKEHDAIHNRALIDGFSAGVTSTATSVNSGSGSLLAPGMTGGSGAAAISPASLLFS
jgi:phage-related tail protein